MNANFVPFINDASTIIKSANDRSKILAYSVALALSRNLPMPTTEHGDPSTYYISQISQITSDIVSCFNEEILLCIRTAMEASRGFWMMRHAAAFPESTPLYDATYGFFDTIVCVGNFFSPEAHAFVNQYKNEILLLSAKASNLMREED